jgi:4'-phosphopantetheinyl transferase
MEHTVAVESVEEVDLVVVPRGPRLSPHAWTTLLNNLPDAEQHRIGKNWRHLGQQDSAVGWRMLMDLAEQHHVCVRRNAAGRPVADPPVDVSLSHGGGWIAVAAHRRGRVGVDVEGVREVSPGLARRCLSTAELSWLERAADAPARLERFLRLWTAKEAYLKAIGTGLGTDPRTFTIDCRAAAPRLVGPEEDRWHFRTSVPADGVRVTVCLERDP